MKFDVDSSQNVGNGSIFASWYIIYIDVIGDGFFVTYYDCYCIESGLMSVSS